MMDFVERLRTERRLKLLQLLTAAPQMGASETLLHSALPDEGLASSLDVVRGDLAWLAEQGLVAFAAGIARLTARGQDAASGLTQVPGVALPRPT